MVHGLRVLCGSVYRGTGGNGRMGKSDRACREADQKGITYGLCHYLFGRYGRSDCTRRKRPYSFVSANYSPGMKYGKSTTTNVAISPQFLTKMVNDSDLEDEYIKEIGNMKKLDEQFAKQQADIGWRVEQGWAIDKDGNISSWAIGHKDSKVKSFLQNMSEKAEEILQKQLEKAKDTKEVFSMKKHKEVIKKNKVDLKV